MFTKIFASMYDGTLATNGPWEALVTFQQLLILCDKDGIVDMTPQAISRRTTIPLEIVNRGIAELEKPDPDSRRKDAEGRRIVRIAPDRTWGWEIVNYAYYRSLRNAEERREYMRDYMRDARAAASKAEDGKAPKRRVPPARINGSFDAFWQVYPRREKRKEAEKAWLKINPDEDTLKAIIAAVERQKASPDWIKEGGKFIPHPSSWLNGERWKDEGTTRPEPVWTP
jgi:hypothetical protein